MAEAPSFAIANGGAVFDSPQFTVNPAVGTYDITDWPFSLSL